MTKLKLDRFKLRKKKFDEEYIEIMEQNNNSTISLYDKVYMLKKIEIKSTSKSLLTNEQLEKIIFNRPQLDLDQWRNFLQNKLFSFIDKDSKLKDAFKKFQNSTEQYRKLLLKEKISLNDTQQAIESLLNNNSLDEYRKRLRIKMQLDENTINEFASSLNLIISNLTDWN
ncbi:unnamed protein product [Rotaria sordida]|uniref:Uncharacterized protein n=2 Tax=Rotaria sordida TaxID=392033 RepID=A0A814TU27_9BILA|nr:unnamed protein product [Rotaria sordida]CAF1413743.1 unnamed protein product [Rotaria sordida]